MRWNWTGAAALLLAAAPPVSASELDAASKACLECHADGKEKMGDSIHAALGCGGCHSGCDAVPHKPRKEPARDCTSCHSDNVQPYFMSRTAHEVRASVHSRVVDENFACTSCHSPHEFIPVRKMTGVPQVIGIANSACLACHDKPELAQKHTWIPMWELHTRSARCVDCHTPGREDTVHLILSARSAQRDCVACHGRDSLLLDKLYKHVAREERKSGFVNAAIMNNAYMIGATKYEGLDRASLIGFGAVGAGIALHALARSAAARRRRS